LFNLKARDWASKGSWAAAVELFTSLDLTVEPDRLPAFFGFASFYAQSIDASIQKDYFAGLWKKTVHQDLIWKIDSSAYVLDPGFKRLCLCFDGSQI